MIQRHEVSKCVRKCCSDWIFFSVSFFLIWSSHGFQIEFALICWAIFIKATFESGQITPASLLLDDCVFLCESRFPWFIVCWVILDCILNFLNIKL